MTKSFKTYTFDECYVPVKYHILIDTTISVQTLATHFGYSSIHALNRFLSDQTGGLSANMIRKEGKDAISSSLL